MTKNKLFTKLTPYILCLSMLSGNVLTADAAGTQPVKDGYGQTDISGSSASDYSVVMPKAVTLDGSKQGGYSVMVKGNIPCSKRVYVSPVDGISDTEAIDFYMEDQASEHGKANVVATIIQNKFYWNHEEAAEAYEETDNSITANGLSAGTWKGIFEVAISLTDDPDHGHEYTETVTKEPTCTEDGERTFTCECGDGYTEPIPATGEHTYMESITKEPVCTEDGEKTYTCKCGDTKTEKIPATGHNYVETITKQPNCTEDGEKTYTCEHCGDTYTEVIPVTHDYKPLWFNHNTPDSKSVSGSQSGTSSKSASQSCVITVPVWYPKDINYTYTGYATVWGYVSGQAYGGSIRSSNYNVTTSLSYSTQKRSGNCSIVLKPGTSNTISANFYISSSSGRTGYAEGGFTLPTLEPYLDRTHHMCKSCGDEMEHYTFCTNPEAEEYYFCEACGLQFRHKCVFDTVNYSQAGECGDAYAAYPCIGDAYDATGKLFTKCSDTKKVPLGINHNWKPYGFTIYPSSSGIEASAYCSVRGQTFTDTKTVTITLPDDFVGTIPYTFTYKTAESAEHSASFYVNGGSVAKDTTGQYTVNLKAGVNTITCTASAVNNTAARYSSYVRLTLPAVVYGDRLNYHQCRNCGKLEEHFTNATDDTLDEYYHCEACDIQIRHRCKFDDNDITVAECEGGYIDLVCVDDYYDTQHDIFTACGETSSIWFDGLGHNWKPYVVQVNPTLNVIADSQDSSYTFSRSVTASETRIHGSAAVKNRTCQTTASFIIDLPKAFKGTYNMPVRFNISSSGFTALGYGVSSYLSNLYDYDEVVDKYNKSDRIVSYQVLDSDTSLGTTGYTKTIELHPGRNMISLTLYCGTSSSSFIPGSASCTVDYYFPKMPFYIFTGKEVHKCERCKIEESHTDQLYETDRKEPTCTNTGYIRYTCDGCGVIYDEIIPVNSDNHRDEDNDKVCDLCGMKLETHIWKIGYTTNKDIKSIVGDIYRDINNSNFIVGYDKFGGGSYDLAVSDDSVLQGANYILKAAIHLMDGFAYNPTSGVFTSDQFWIETNIPGTTAGTVHTPVNIYTNPMVYVTDGPVIEAKSTGSVNNTDGLYHVYKLPDSRDIDVKSLLKDPAMKLSNDNFIVLGQECGKYSDSEWKAVYDPQGLMYTKVDPMSISYNYDDTTGHLTVSGGRYLSQFYDSKTGFVFRQIDVSVPLAVYLIINPEDNISAINTLSIQSDDDIYSLTEGISISIDEIDDSGEEGTESSEGETASDEDEKNFDEDAAILDGEETVSVEDDTDFEGESSQ